jgi:hypothetical protein
MIFGALGVAGPGLARRASKLGLGPPGFDSHCAYFDSHRAYNVACKAFHRTLPAKIPDRVSVPLAKKYGSPPMAATSARFPVRRFLASFGVRRAAVAIASNATKRRSGRFCNGDREKTMCRTRRTRPKGPRRSGAPRFPLPWSIEEHDACYIVRIGIGVRWGRCGRKDKQKCTVLFQNRKRQPHISRQLAEQCLRLL